MTNTDVAPLDLTGYRPATLRDQAQPQLIWAPVDRLVIDRRYQRSVTPAGRRAIQRIADGFDWTKYQPILVAPHIGGVYAVVDGQHRAHAAALVGLEAIPAMVVPMTPAQQAASFYAVNTARIALDGPAKFRAALATGEDWALAIRDAAQAAGCAIATYQPSYKNRQPRILYHTTCLRRLHAGGEDAVITPGLRAIVESSSADDIESYGAQIVTAWLGAIATNQRFLRLPLADIFDVWTFEELRADSVQAARRCGGTAADILKARLVSVLHQARDRADAA